MHRVLAYLIGLILLCDLAVVGVHTIDERTGLVTGRRAGQDGGAPAAGQAFVTGDVKSLVADSAQTERLSSPFTITAVERGAASLTIENALVSGQRVDISWDGGTPLSVSGEGGLELGATRLEVDGETIVWALAGDPRAFVPGTYRVAAPVAVGTGRLATPREGVEFTADGQTVLVARGNVVVRERIRRVAMTGGGKLTVTGRLQVRFPERRTSVRSVTLEEGPFRATVEPRDGAVQVDAVLQGAVQTG